MIRPLATFIHVLDAARTAGTLARTVLVLSRQLDNAHLLAASEEARADRAELRVAELEAQTRDWAELSGELAREQPTADPLPSVLDAGEAPIPLVLTDSAREADIQRDRADSLAASLRAAELDLIKLRAELEKVAERKIAADIRADVQRERAKQAERERDTNARAAGAHIATIEDLRARLDLALRAVHRPAPIEQIPGVPAAYELPCQCGHERRVHSREGCAAVVHGSVCRCERFQVYGRDPVDPPDSNAGRSEAHSATTDDSPPTRPSERAATRTT